MKKRKSSGIRMGFFLSSLVATTLAGCSNETVPPTPPAVATNKLGSGFIKQGKPIRTDLPPGIVLPRRDDVERGGFGGGGSGSFTG